MNRMVSFHLASAIYGIDAGSVLEILRPQPITPVPGAAHGVAGLINVRGQILTAVDLRCRLGYPPAGTAMNVLVRTADGPVSLLVDRIGDVLEIDADQLVPPPDTLPAILRGLVTASYPFPDRLVLVLDADRATSTEGEGGFS